MAQIDSNGNFWPRESKNRKWRNKEMEIGERKNSREKNK